MYAEAIDFINNIMNEKIAIAGKFIDKNWHGSYCIETRFIDNKLNEELDFLENHGSELIIKSANKTFNRDINFNNITKNSM